MSVCPAGRAAGDAGRHWILPVLADVPLERLNGAQVGLRWADADLDAGYVRVRRPIVLARGAVSESTPKTKTKTGDRLIWLDAETVRILKEHCTAQLKARVMAGGVLAGQRSDLLPGRRHTV